MSVAAESKLLPEFTDKMIVGDSMPPPGSKTIQAAQRGQVFKLPGKISNLGQ